LESFTRQSALYGGDMAVYKGEERNWRFRLVDGPNADARR
jgi:hypothetical protein